MCCTQRIFLFGLLLVWSIDQKAASLSMMITAENAQQRYQELSTQLPQSLLVQEVTYQSDIVFSQKEFCYLTDLRDGMAIRATDLQQAIFYLLAKNRFASVTLSIKEAAVGVKIHFDLIGQWLFAGLKIHGFFIGRNRYWHHYLLQEGDLFDKKKHDHSVLMIRQELQKDGYFHSTINERFVYDKQNKYITVHVDITRGAQSRAGNVCCKVLGSSDGVADVQAEINRRFCQALPGRLIGKDALNKTAQGIKQYLNSCGYFQSTLELKETLGSDHKVDLIFIIDLHEKKQFVFFGNTFFSHQQLLDQLLLFGSTASLLAHTILVEEIVQLYHDAGFLSATVHIEDEKDKLIFIIKEGERSTFQEISIKGITYFSLDEILKKVGWKKIYRTPVEKKRLDAVCACIIQQYNQAGFWQTIIESAQVHEHQNGTILKIVIKEGYASYIDAVSVHLPEGYRPKQLGLYRADIPEVFTSQTILKHKVILENEYPDLAFNPTIGQDDHKVNIVWHGVHMEPETFGKTIIVGNSKLPFDYIMRELRYHEGQAWDPLQIRRTMVALKELDIFDQITLYPYQAEVPFNKRPVMLKIIPDDPFEVRARSGIGLEYAGKELTYNGLTYKLGGALVFKNPFNRADYFFANADFTRTHRIMQAGYWQPWLFGYPMQTLLQAYNNAFEYPSILANQRNLYKVTQTGGLLGLVNKWRIVEGGLNLGFECMQTTMSNRRPQEGAFNRLIARAINFKPALLDTMVPYFMLEPTLFINSLDNQLFPTCGSMTLLSCKGMIPLGRLDETFFVKIMAEQSVFVPLHPSVLALRLRFGHIFYQEFNTIMPSERFYLGGANSIRSYQTDLCPPLGIVPECPVGSGQNYVPQGGKSMLNINVELRLPLYKGFWGAVFQDIGFLHGGNNLFDLIKQSLLAGTGFGIRYNTPIGPLRFDIGFKWKKPAQNIPLFAWFLTLGQPF